MARYFVQFKPNSTLSNKLMVFTGLTEEEVRNEVNREYGAAVMRIFSEPQAAQIIPSIYSCQNQWIPFGTDCTYYKRDCNGKTVGEIQYPVSKHTEPYKEYSVSLKSIFDWFKTAKPMPVDKNITTQMGAHFEEVNEMVVALSNSIVEADLETEKADLHNKLKAAQNALYELSQALYKDSGFKFPNGTRVELLDSLADQVVTATGVAYFHKFKWDEALTEVNQSNYSKFENGKPVLNEDGKIMKGKDYFKPNLEKYV